MLVEHNSQSLAWGRRFSTNACNQEQFIADLTQWVCLVESRAGLFVKKPRRSIELDGGHLLLYDGIRVARHVAVANPDAIQLIADDVFCQTFLSRQQKHWRRQARNKKAKHGKT